MPDKAEADDLLFSAYECVRVYPGDGVPGKVVATLRPLVEGSVS